MTRILVVLVLLATAVAGAQQTHTPQTRNPLATPVPSPVANPVLSSVEGPNAVEGQRLFVQRCASCHGLHLEGSAQGPPLVNVDAIDVDFQLRTGRMPAEVPWEQEFDKPPAFTHAQIAGIVAYVMSRSSGNKQLPIVRLGNVQHGREIYAENCEQCHAATARGNAVGYADIAPSLMDASPQEIAEAVRMGPDVMPPFSTKQIDDRAMGDLAAYIEFLQNAKYNPGGLQLANIGPVAEGFIGWVFGIGLLVLLVRRIGTTE